MPMVVVVGLVSVSFDYQLWCEKLRNFPPNLPGVENMMKNPVRETRGIWTNEVRMFACIVAKWV